MLEGDLYPTDETDPVELAELPVHLIEPWSVYTMLEVDEQGSARIWSSGVVALDEFDVRGQERLQWLRLWHRANMARAEMAELAREAAKHDK